MLRYQKYIENVEIPGAVKDPDNGNLYIKSSSSELAGKDLQEITTVAAFTQQLPLSIIVTKPPESIFLHINKDESIVLFDSHPRHGENYAFNSEDNQKFQNSHFICFKNAETAAKYLGRLFEDKGTGISVSDNLTAQQWIMIEYIAFKFKADVNKDNLLPNKQEIGQFIKELNKIGKGIKPYENTKTD